MQVDELADGYYQIRSRKAGPWIPVRVFVEGGGTVPWEIISPDFPVVEWHPRMDSIRGYRISPFRILNRLHPISKDEFEWLLILRTLPSRQR